MKKDTPKNTKELKKQMKKDEKKVIPKGIPVGVAITFNPKNHWFDITERAIVNCGVLFIKAVIITFAVKTVLF